MVKHHTNLCMRIGIDLDGVIFDSEKLYRIYSELYDIQDLKKNSIRNNREIKFQDRYSWSEEETDGFVKKYHRKITEVSNFMPGAKDIIPLLKEEGHTLIVITARGKLNKDLIPITIQRLKDNDLDIFEKYYWGTENKEEICKQEKIDLMIDDSNKNCEKLAKDHIHTIYLKDAPSFDVEENEYLKVLYNWGEIYRYIKQLEEN